MHLGEVRAFLMKYYGNEKSGVSLSEPLGTVTTNDRFGLVTVEGCNYQIVDIGMRMLQPHELYRAQGFPDWYVIDQDFREIVMRRTSKLLVVVMLFRLHLLRHWCAPICLSYVLTSGSKQHDEFNYSPATCSGYLDQLSA